MVGFICEKLLCLGQSLLSLGSEEEELMPVDCVTVP